MLLHSLAVVIQEPTYQNAAHPVFYRMASFTVGNQFLGDLSGFCVSETTTVRKRLLFLFGIRRFYKLFY